MRHQYVTQCSASGLMHQYGLKPMLCISHHDMARTCASCINMARCGASMTSSCASCIHMAQYSMTHHAKFTTYFVHLVFTLYVKPTPSQVIAI